MPTPSIANPIGPINQSSRWKSARACVRKTAGAAHAYDVDGAKQAAEVVTAACFGQFSKQMTTLELGACQAKSRYAGRPGNSV